MVYFKGMEEDGVRDGDSSKQFLMARKPFVKRQKIPDKEKGPRVWRGPNETLILRLPFTGWGFLINLPVSNQKSREKGRVDKTCKVTRDGTSGDTGSQSVPPFFVTPIARALYQTLTLNAFLQRKEVNAHAMFAKTTDRPKASQERTQDGAGETTQADSAEVAL